MIHCKIPSIYTVVPPPPCDSLSFAQVFSFVLLGSMLTWARWHLMFGVMSRMTLNNDLYIGTVDETPCGTSV